ncbi:hypothetical protein LPW11_03095 [Geomonas sp. RF6]|uniref:hypothetical protein n=1 Tax=Geomonas sp. RF6 TaxID=2897342 RepID=UPI001E401322|nr:hypothetical protein [Geomonas sp. RF6]UFS71186.1 hypothetical protein LPW11_03095 [Geomonas sp. RF6]
MNRLLEIGFSPVGSWILSEGELQCELHRDCRNTNVLYAFVSDGEVKYIGKSIRTLRQRMQGYQRPGATQSTNIKNNLRIRDLLAGGAAVQVLALVDNGHLRYGQFHLNLAAGLEDDLIRVLDPEWNGGKKEVLPAQEQARVEEPVTEDEPLAQAEFRFVLQQTYYNQGFFNVGVDHQHYFGGDGERIEVQVGTCSTPFAGTINRRANSNGTPRIMVGSALKTWFQECFNVLDIVAVETFSSNSIRLWKSDDGANQ